MDGTTVQPAKRVRLHGAVDEFRVSQRAQGGYGYNAAGGVETVSLAAGTNTYRLITNITYNAAGQVTRMAYGNGVVSDYSYNPQTLKLDHKHTANAGGVVLQDFAYTRDPVGNIESITDTVNTGTQSFQYDGLNRLTRATGASYGTQVFGYDAIGNMTTKAGVTMSYGAGAAGPHAVTATSSGLTLSYDVDGNMTGKVSSVTGDPAGDEIRCGSRLAEVLSNSTGSNQRHTRCGDEPRRLPVLGQRVGCDECPQTIRDGVQPDHVG